MCDINGYLCWTADMDTSQEEEYEKMSGWQSGWQNHTQNEKHTTRQNNYQNQELYSEPEFYDIGNEYKRAKKIQIAVILCISILIIGIGLLAAFLLFPSVQKNQYEEKIQAAGKYLQNMDYQNAIIAYQAAIRLNPDNQNTYILLADVYQKTNQYSLAKQVLEQGHERTKSTMIEYMLSVLIQEESAQSASAGSTDEKTENVYYVIEEEQKELIVQISRFSHNRYRQNYGNPDMRFLSEEEGYQVHYDQLSGYCYYKNTEQSPNSVDSDSGLLYASAKPYAVSVSDITQILGQFTGQMSLSQLEEMFQTEAECSYDNAKQMYLTTWIYGNCKFCVEADQEGNISSQNPWNRIYPLTGEIEEETSESETETQTQEESDVVAVGDYEYDTDVEEIDIRYEYVGDLDGIKNCTKLKKLHLTYCEVVDIEGLSECDTIETIYIDNGGEDIGDLQALGGCKNLKSLVLINCQITDISAIGECEKLEEICLDDNPFSDISPLAKLKKLKWLQFHNSDVSDISSLMEQELEFFNPCSPNLSFEQTQEYKRRYPSCIVYFDYFIL